MDHQLYLYLKHEWINCNSLKYYSYFDTWIKNLTNIQIYYYNTLWMK